MTKTIQVKVYPDLIKVFENIRRGIAEEMKKRYGLTEIVVPMTLASQVLAAEKMNKKCKGWVYEIPSYQAKNLTKPLDEILEDIQKKEETDKANEP